MLDESTIAKELDELDVFDGLDSPLTIAEVKFRSDSEARNFPGIPWFSRCVTEENEYSNYNISLRTTF